MNKSLKKTFRIYKYFSIIFIVGFLVFAIIDNYNKIIEYWNTSPLILIIIWYLIVYFIVFSILFWAFSIITVFIYHKMLNK